MRSKTFSSRLTWLLALALVMPALLLPVQPVRAQARVVKELFSSAARGTTNGTGEPVRVEHNALTAILNVTAKSAGATSLDVKIQDSADNSIWDDLTGCTFTQVTGSTATQTVVASRSPAAYVRAVATVAGSSTPTFTFSVRVVMFTANQVVTATTSLDADLLTTGTVPTARLSEDTVRTASVNLSAANIIAMGTTPVELLAAPGSGKITLVQSVTLKMVRTSTAFTGGGALEFRYTNASGAKVSADIAASVVTTGGAGTEYNHVGGVIASFTPVANAAIVITNATAPFADGTGTAVVTIKYRIITP